MADNPLAIKNPAKIAPFYLWTYNFMSVYPRQLRRKGRKAGAKKDLPGNG